MAAQSPSTGEESFLTALAAGLDTMGFWAGPAVVAVSGGADSVALLVGIAKLAAGRGSPPPLTVAHAVHDMRPTAEHDAAVVSALAGRLGLPCRTGAIAVRATAHGGEGVEGLARRLRYRFLLDVARDANAASVAVAHTAADQAETILHRVARGTGLVGLAGMPARRRLGDGVELIRPLLEVPATGPRAFLAGQGVTWCEDETNVDRRFARNFLRHEILPRLAAGPYPSVQASLVRLGRQAAAAAAALEGVARGLLDGHTTKRADGAIVIDSSALAGCDPHLVAEMFAVLWRREGWPRRHMGQGHYARLAALVCDRGRGRIDLPGGVRAMAMKVDGRRHVTVGPPARCRDH
jgi:tRNA(Ile)-lysidine synthase